MRDLANQHLKYR